MFQRVLNNMAIGLSNLNPFSNKYNIARMPPKALHGITLHYDELVKTLKPLRFMITLTFSMNMSFTECCKHINRYLHNHNRLLFGCRYYKHPNLCINGVAFFESHKSLASNNDIHVHILVRDDIMYADYSLIRHGMMFYFAASKVVNSRKRPVFNIKGIDMTEVENDGAISYCFKDIWDKNLTRIKVIGRGGLTDSL